MAELGRELSYDDLSPEHAKRLAAAYTEIAMVYKAAGSVTLEKVAALQAAWFRNKAEHHVVPV